MTMQKLGNFNYPLPLLIAAAAGLVIVGLVTSWADARIVTYAGDQIRTVSINGTDGAGYVTLVAGALAGLLVIWRLARRRSNWLALGGALVLFLFSGVSGVASILDVGTSTGAFRRVWALAGD